MQSASAHPHSWIDMKASLLLDEQGHLIAITQRWSFDVYFSMVTIADAEKEYADKQTGLTKTAETIINNLGEYEYFSELNIDGIELKLPRPSSFRLTEVNTGDEPILELEMRFEIPDPPRVNNKTLAWSVFDPTYYIAMNYSQVNNVSVVGKDASQCQLALDLPQPSFELIEYAQNLDRSRRDTDGLGIHFAETIRMKCVSGES